MQLCVGGTLNLGTNVQGEAITYLWTGPEGYSSTLRVPAPITNVGLKNAGQRQKTLADPSNTILLPGFN